MNGDLRRGKRVEPLTGVWPTQRAQLTVVIEGAEDVLSADAKRSRDLLIGPDAFSGWHRGRDGLSEESLGLSQAID